MIRDLFNNGEDQSVRYHVNIAKSDPEQTPYMEIVRLGHRSTPFGEHCIDCCLLEFASGCSSSSVGSESGAQEAGVVDFRNHLLTFHYPPPSCRLQQPEPIYRPPRHPWLWWNADFCEDSHGKDHHP